MRGLRFGNLASALADSGGGFTLGWESSVAISTVGDTIIETTGTLIEAVMLGSVAGNRTVNGVDFVAATSRDGLTSAFYNVGNYTGGVVGADFEAMLDSFCFRNIDTTITLTGLTSGKTYLFQILVSDMRYTGRTGTYSVGGYTTASTDFNPGYSRICRFEASGTTEVVSITSTNFRLMNGFQVRQLD